MLLEPLGNQSVEADCTPHRVVRRHGQLGLEFWVGQRLDGVVAVRLRPTRCRVVRLGHCFLPPKKKTEEV